MRSVVFHFGPQTGTGRVARYTPSPMRFIGATTAPPPCHAVTTNQRACSAASGGGSRALTTTWRWGGGETCVSVAVTFGTLPLGIGIAHAMTATAATPARGPPQRGARPPTLRPPVTERPIQPPSTPPAIPATSAQMTPSTISAGVHGL